MQPNLRGSFAELLRRARSAAGYSQEELADKAGLSLRGVSDLERGVRRKPRLKTVRLLSDALAIAGEDRAALFAAARGDMPGPAPDRGMPAAAIGHSPGKARAARPHNLPAPVAPLLGREHELTTIGARAEELGLVREAGGLLSASAGGPHGDGWPPPQLGRAITSDAATQRYDLGDPPCDQMLLPLPDRLIGRTEELEWLVERLRQGGTISITALVGMGGIGKTSLAAVAVRQACQEGHFRDGVAVVLCHEMTDAAEVLRQVIARFDARRHQPQTIDPRRLAQVALRTLRGKGALIVLDNVEPGLAIAEVVRPLREAEATLLLTARHALPRNVVPIHDSCRLELLAEDEALELFWHAHGRHGAAATATDRLAAARIVAALDRHTLAVKLAGTYAGDARHDLGKLAGELEADPLDIPEGETPRAVTVAFSRSMAALPQGASDLFTALGACETAECGREAVLALGRGVGISQPKAALDTLALRALVEVQVASELPEIGDRERVRLHPLLRACARERFAAWREEKRAAARLALASYYAVYIQGDEARDMVRARDRENITAALEWVHAHERHELVVALCAGMGPFWRNRRVKAAWLRYMPWGVAAGKALGQNTDDRAVIMHAAAAMRVYGRMLSMLGRQDEAAQMLREALRLRRRLGDHHGEAEGLFAVGQLALFAGDAVEGEQYLRASLAFWAAHPDLPVPDWRDQAIDYASMVQLAQRRAAVEVLERYCLSGLEIARGRGDPYWEGALLFTLGQAALVSGRLDEARRTFRQVISMGYRFVEQQGTAAALLCLARAELAANCLDAAEQRLHESRELLGDVRQEVYEAWVMGLLAQIACRRGRVDEARVALERIAATQEELQDPLGEGESLLWLAGLANERDELARAERLFRKSLQRFGEAMSGPDMAKGNLTLGRFLIERHGKREEGCALLREALQRYHEMGLPDAQGAQEELYRLGCDV